MAKDLWNESHKTIATQEEWEKRRPLLRATFENYLTSHDYITCRGCHALDALARRKFGRRSRSGAERRILARLLYEGAKLLTVWGDRSKAPAAQYAGRTFTTQRNRSICSLIYSSKTVFPAGRSAWRTRESSPTRFHDCRGVW